MELGLATAGGTGRCCGSWVGLSSGRPALKVVRWRPVWVHSLVVGHGVSGGRGRRWQVGAGVLWMTEWVDWQLWLALIWVHCSVRSELEVRPW